MAGPCVETCYQIVALGLMGSAPPLGDAVGLGYHAGIMRCRRVALLVAVYLALDFANPMMPGAVQIVGGSFQTVAGCQARSGDVPVLAVTVVPGHLSLAMRQPESALRKGRRVVSVSPPVPVFFRAPLEPRSTPASSADDD